MPLSSPRVSWDEAKKEAGVAHVPDLVPRAHLTVGERKRLQWARERGEKNPNANQTSSMLSSNRALLAFCPRVPYFPTDWLRKRR